MKKRYLYAMSLALALAVYSGQSAAQEVECEKAPEETPKCEGDPQAPTVHISISDKKIKVTPKCVRAFRGANIVFRITPKVGLEKESVEIFPKDDFDTWLVGVNDKFDDLILIEIPGTHDPDSGDRAESVHDYGIIAKGMCIDPRIRVEH